MESRWSLDGSIQAKIEMVLDQCLLRLADGLFDGMKLLREIEPGAARRDHVNDAPEVSFGASQALADTK